MADFAELGIQVDSRSVPRAEADLRRLAATGGQVERRVTAQAGAMGASWSRMARLAAAAGAAVGIATTILGGRAIQSARSFDAALAETSTLIEGTSRELGILAANASTFARTYGVDATQQMNAFYQAISAGAGTVENASVLLEQANRLAIGGVTGLTNAVDTLTLATNAYGSAGMTAADAADILFTGVRLGRTTMNELGASLGNVVPIASSLGIGLDEVVGAAAALTTQGQSTAMAMTGVRAILASVVAPTQQASEMAERLGLQFNTAALRAQGLRGFLQSVTDATGGNQEAMAQLFGSIEALNAVLAFSGGAGTKFNEAMEAMGERAGAADEAFNRVSQSLSQRLNVQLTLLGDVARGAGEVMLSLIVPALEAVTSGVAAASEFLGGFEGYFISSALALTAYFIPAIWGAVTATSAWVASLITLRGAIIATGFGAFIVGAGYLINLLLTLRERTASWGEALALLGEVASGVWAGIVSTAAAIPDGLSAVWNRVKTGFLAMIFELTRAWAGFLQGFSAGLPQGGIVGGAFDGMREAIDGARASALAYQQELNGVMYDSRMAGEAAQAAWDGAVSNGFERAREALAALRATMAEAGGETTNTAAAIAAINEALGETPAAAAGAAGGVGEVGDAATEAQSRLESMAGNMSRFFMQIIRGGDAARQAISQLLSRAAEMLMNRALMSLLEGSSAGKGGGIFGGLLNLLFNADGGVYRSPSLSAYSGGVYTTPRAFAFANGGVPGQRNVGVFAEAGPEAIMPLKRGRDGKLGVAASGGGGGGAGGGRLSIGFDATMQAFVATLRDETGRVVNRAIQSAKPGIVSQAVQATHASFGEVRPG